MSASSSRDTCLFIFGVLCATCLPSQNAMAGDSSLLSRISPHISLNQNTPSQNLGTLSLNKKPHIAEYSLQDQYYAPPPKKSMGDQDLFSMALGARFQIIDWLGVDATFSLPLVEEEIDWRQDFSIEAMVTMQF